MAEESGYPVGNQDPNKRGRNLPRQDREPDQETEQQRRGVPRGQVNYGDVTKNPDKS